MLTYKSDPKLKKLFVKEMELHREADDFLKGTYGTTREGEWKGCAVGCGVKSLNLKLGKKYDTSDHSAYEKELGIPEWLARLEDTLFEGLPLEESKKWPVEFSKAVPVGKDVSRVKWQFCAYLLKENIERVLKLDIEDSLKEQVVKAIQGSLKVNEDAIENGTWDESAAWSAARSARSAARSARSAESAAWSAAESAESAAWSAESAAESAESAARSAAESAESAAWSAAWSARSAARSAAYTRHSEELLKLLKAVK